jgi:hypothetical protein
MTNSRHPVAFLYNKRGETQGHHIEPDYVKVGRRQIQTDEENRRVKISFIRAFFDDLDRKIAPQTLRGEPDQINPIVALNLAPIFIKPLAIKGRLLNQCHRLD